MKTVTSQTDPACLKPFIGALVFSTIHIPGDERSRTCPGHGYPAHDERTCSLIVFDSEAECRGWIAKNQTEKFVILNCEPRSVRIEQVVNLD